MFASPQQQRAEEQASPTADCVYFLASPLTCKKGSECEYRHSEYARLNPRDCYYWLNANCLNPKCGFRHPPLDGLLGTQVAAPAGASASSAHTAVPALTHAPYSSSAPYNSVAPSSSSSSKAAAPCIFFQKGYCLKGDRCAFLHGPVPTSNKAQPATAANPVARPPSSQKTFGAHVLPLNITKIVEVPREHKPAPKVEAFPLRNGVGAERYAPQAGLNEEVPRYKATTTRLGVNESSTGHAKLSHQAHAFEEQSYHPGKDTDEHLRESSPGFDVLVEDQLGDEEYYHGENQYGGQEGRKNEYDKGRPVNYDVFGDIDREMLRDTRGYDSYKHMHGQYDWDQRRASSEKTSLGTSHPERRGYSKAESPDRIGESDMRYRLSKHRKNNGLRSGFRHDCSPENRVEERSYQNSSRRGSHQQESSLSSRLRGRIKLPGRSPVNDTNSRSERSWGRLSPGRPQISHSGRLKDRIKGRVEDRNIRDGLRMRKEIMDDTSPNFAPPKRLAELKVVKNVDNKEHHVLRKRKAQEDNQQSVEELSFKGPMPLSEILKRKRQAKTEHPENGSSLRIREKVQSVVSPASIAETNKKEESKHVYAEEGKIEESSQQAIVSDHEVEDGMIVDEGIEEHQLEGEGEGEDGEEYYYEQGDEGSYDYEDAENLGPEEEYLDDDDGDDFAKTIGVISS